MFNDWVGEEGSRAQANKMHVLSWTEKEPISATFLVKFISIQVDVPTSIVWFFLLLLFCFYMLTSISTFCGSNTIAQSKENDRLILSAGPVHWPKGFTWVLPNYPPSTTLWGGQHSHTHFADERSEDTMVEPLTQERTQARTSWDWDSQLKSLHFTQWSQAAYLLGPNWHHTKLMYISIHSLDKIMKLF